ncbi:ABC transporter ATP-binding protein [Aureivirga sp. CE67]|uniref:ABC transporter ATP-binding protein n=1 Tax=Aureivirga sp. CE67 TaxID=1788983 RepID=UPI0018CB1CA6|nr:ABC transporter ATP-binding protein [Aureivirga sp. CE67]
MIQINNISKVYGENTVLSIPELTIQKGECLGLVGNNGAGKTTLFNSLLDLIKPTTGTISNKGIEVHKSEDWKQFTGSFIDETFLIEYLTPNEYFDFIAGIRNVSKGDLENLLNSFSEFFNEEILGAKKYLRDLSKGNQKKVGIVASLIGNPEVIILDEPFANLDPTTQIRLKNMLQKLVEDKDITLLISSHDLGHVTDVCNRIVVLEKGEVIKDIITSESTLKELETIFAV